MCNYLRALIIMVIIITMITMIVIDDKPQIGSWAGCTGAWLMAGVPGQIVCNVATVIIFIVIITITINFISIFVFMLIAMMIIVVMLIVKITL